MGFFIGELVGSGSSYHQRAVGAYCPRSMPDSEVEMAMTALERVSGLTRGGDLPSPNEAGYVIRPLSSDINPDAVKKILGQIAPVVEYPVPVIVDTLVDKVGATAFKGIFVLPIEVELAAYDGSLQPATAA